MNSKKIKRRQRYIFLLGIGKSHILDVSACFDSSMAIYIPEQVKRSYRLNFSRFSVLSQSVGVRIVTAA